MIKKKDFIEKCRSLFGPLACEILWKVYNERPLTEKEYQYYRVKIKYQLKDCREIYNVLMLTSAIKAKKKK